MSKKKKNYYIQNPSFFIPRHHKLNFPIRQKDVPTLKIKEKEDVDSVQ